MQWKGPGWQVTVGNLNFDMNGNLNLRALTSHRLRRHWDEESLLGKERRPADHPWQEAGLDSDHLVISIFSSSSFELRFRFAIATEAYLRHGCGNVYM